MYFPILVIAMCLIPSTPLSSTRNTLLSLSTSLRALTPPFHNHLIHPSTGSSHTLPRSQLSSSQSNIGNHALTLHDPKLISSTTTALPIPMLPAHCQIDSTILQIREFYSPLSKRVSQTSRFRSFDTATPIVSYQPFNSFISVSTIHHLMSTLPRVIQHGGTLSIHLPNDRLQTTRH